MPRCIIFASQESIPKLTRSVSSGFDFLRSLKTTLRRRDQSTPGEVQALEQSERYVEEEILQDRAKAEGSTCPEVWEH